MTDPFVVRWKGGWKMYFKTETRAAGGAGPKKPAADSPGPWDSDVIVYRVSADGAVAKAATSSPATSLAPALWPSCHNVNPIMWLSRA